MAKRINYLSGKRGMDMIVVNKIKRDKAMEERTVEKSIQKKRIFGIFVLYLLFTISFNLALYIPALLDEAKAQTISGQGDGTIEVYCDGKPCNNNYMGGSAIKIIARPNKNSKFVGWSGMCKHTRPICKFTMPNKGVKVTAHFELKDKKDRREDL